MASYFFRTFSRGFNRSTVRTYTLYVGMFYKIFLLHMILTISIRVITPHPKCLCLSLIAQLFHIKIRLITVSGYEH